MSKTPSSSKALDDKTIPVRVSGSLDAMVAISYGCPQEPDQCTVSDGPVSLAATAGLMASARASLATGADSTVSCSLTLRVTTSAVVIGEVVVDVASSSGNILIPDGSRSHTFRGLSPGPGQSASIPFTFVGLGAGGITITLKVGSLPTSVMQMNVNVA